MQTRPLITVCTIAFAAVVVAASSPSHAQKTVKECDTEWQANKAAIQASGKTKKEYVATCRQGAGTARSTAASRNTKAGPTVTQPQTERKASHATAAKTSGSQKTVKECDAEWQANKASIQASGQTKKQYVAGCRGGTGNATAQQAPSRSPRSTPADSQAARTSPAPTAQAPAVRERNTERSAREKTTRTPQTNSGQAAAAQYSSIVAAKAHCPADTVVWVNTDTKIYHYSESARYGKTKDGAYMCEKDTAAAGFRPAKNEKHP
jgi:hypothetical protein